MPKIYGALNASAIATIESRADFNRAIRDNDQKMLLGFNDVDADDGEGISGFGGMLGMQGILPGMPTNRFGGYADYLACGTKKVWATARAVDLVANVIISTETTMVFKDDAKNKAKAKPKPDPALLLLLQNPNPYETISEFIYLLVAHLKLTGNAFWLKDEMNGYGQPKALYAINPRLMRIVPDKNLRVGYYLYKVNNKDIRFEPDEIIHFKKGHANDALWGLGEIESGESLYDDFINRALFNTRFMANGAMPSAVLAREEAAEDQDQWNKNKQSFQEQYQGVKNSGKVAWLNGKWSVLKLGCDAAAMQEIERSAANIEDIFVNHGVPLSIAGYSKHSNYATAKQDDISFRRYGCLPWLNIIADVMNSERGFVSKFNNGELKWSFRLSGLIDVEQVIKENAPMFDRAGLTPNDMRELVGMERVENPYLDQYFMSNLYVPVELAGITQLGDAGEPEPGPANPDDPETGKPPKPGKPGEVNTADGTPAASQSEDAPGKPTKKRVRFSRFR